MLLIMSLMERNSCNKDSTKSASPLFSYSLQETHNIVGTWGEDPDVHPAVTVPKRVNGGPAGAWGTIFGIHQKGCGVWHRIVLEPCIRLDLVTTHNAGDLTQFINLSRPEIHKRKPGKKETEGRKERAWWTDSALIPPQRNHNSHLTCFVPVFNYLLLIWFCGTMTGALASCIPGKCSISSGLLPGFLTPNVM